MAEAFKLTAFGQVVASTETNGFPTWEAWAIAHLSKPCDESVPCDLHREWEQHKASARGGTQHTHTRSVKGCYRCELGGDEVRAQRQQIISERLERNRAALEKAHEKLAAFYRANTQRNDPAVGNSPLRSRPGRITDAKLDQHRKLAARVQTLTDKVLMDEARLRRLS